MCTYDRKELWCERTRLLHSMVERNEFDLEYFNAALTLPATRRKSSVRLNYAAQHGCEPRADLPF